MFEQSVFPGTKRGAKGLLAGLLAASLLVFPTLAEALQWQEASAMATATQASPTHRSSPYHPARIPSRAKEHYQSIWGVDNFLVRQTASGNLIRFSYRVVDPVRAEALGDARLTPYLIAPTRGVALQVPAMEQVGDLRQKGKPVTGKEYWMVFSNKGNPVKASDPVNVVIGSFHADGLKVE